jgi:CRISPR system Cascade subunit CasA
MLSPSDDPPGGGPNVLSDPLFTVDCGDRMERLALPALLARLLTPESGVRRLARLAAEQHGPVWRFLVRCGAEALHALGRPLPAPGTASDAVAREVASVLAARAGGLPAWGLHEPDVGRPAFLQPPLPNVGEPAAAGYKPTTVARLTLAVGGKNHERKADSGRVLDAESLVAALITFQGGAIYTKGNYASQLMGSGSGKGSGSPYVGARLAGTLDVTFRHDVQTVLAEWETVRRERGLRGGVWALWTVPWDGESSISVETLDPAFIPCARLVRVGAPDADGRWSSAWYRSTTKARVSDPTEGSGLGDPFLPLVSHPKRPGDRKARGTMGTGYRYDEVVRLLFGDSARPGAPSPSVAALLDTRPPDGARIRFEGMAFDQGKTLGFHHREILVPAGNYLDFEDGGEIRALHADFLQVVKDAQAALRAAARILLLGSPKPNRHAAAKTEAGAQTLQSAVDAVYVDRLLAAARAARAGDANSVDAWRAWVREQALRAFEQTRHAVPTPTSTRYQREVSAEAYLRRKLAAPQPEATLTDTAPEEHGPIDHA